ncbi:hypothetical protein HanRHA438_Chr11g0508321 [Helianthus annuus]|uniref:Uncharacterized protein n=1 Tax=Helianthus annuus TaxID=4232 RepID=A0A9K3HQD9_HELAN|nr:hypothetical protein HanXRQr2_Chr11g0495721 [Helianthus annuus]KAJ0871100.1 hypothetical protein HanRHA438_Chr11g0508321 [Helianthus annuus]KAJ0875548.1 hypothetical protein HanPSC8_Chr11g0477711 [Helianthus annuus]
MHMVFTVIDISDRTRVCKEEDIGFGFINFGDQKRWSLSADDGCVCRVSFLTGIGKRPVVIFPIKSG